MTSSGVTTAEVRAYHQPFPIEIDGEAATYRVVTIGAEVEGRVVRKAAIARGGTYVRKGDELFEIDPTVYQLEVDRLQAQLRQAEEELAAVAVDMQNTAELIVLAEEDWQLQKKHLTRMKELLARKTANDTEVETAMKQELTARSALQTHRNQRNRLHQDQKTKQASKELVETQLKRARVDLERCLVKSPPGGKSRRGRSRGGRLHQTW